MTRFEALGVLPDKSIPLLKRYDDENDLWKVVKRISPERLVDQLPEEATYRIVLRKKQPKLGFLLKVTTKQKNGIWRTYIRLDQRKVKRNAKRFDWKLPQVDTDETHK